MLVLGLKATRVFVVNQVVDGRRVVAYNCNTPENVKMTTQHTTNQVVRLRSFAFLRFRGITKQD